MFNKLREDAAKIEIGIKKLHERMPHLIHNYTYHNRDADEVLKEKFDWVNSVNSDLSQFQESNQEFVAVLNEFENMQQTIKKELNDLVDELQIQLPEDLTQEETAESKDSVDEAASKLKEMGLQALSPNNCRSDDDSPYYNVAIQKIGAPETPAFRPISSRKGRFQ